MTHMITNSIQTERHTDTNKRKDDIQNTKKKQHQQDANERSIARVQEIRTRKKEQQHTETRKRTA